MSDPGGLPTCLSPRDPTRNEASMALELTERSAPKQVIVMRRDLRMRRGKEIAQGSHTRMIWLALRPRQRSSSKRSGLRHDSRLSPEG